MTRSSPSVTAIILNWNNYDDTHRCVESLSNIEYDIEIFVVDNGSTDNSVKKLRNSFPGIEILKNNKNLGFAGGMNRGISEAKNNNSDYVLLLNNDVVVRDDPKLLSKLVYTAESNSNVGVVSPKILNYPQIESTWFEYGRVDLRDGTVTQSLESDTEKERITNDFIPLCFCLVDMDTVSEVGMIPEGYFLYFEDIDYSKRIRNAGFELVTRLDLHVYHEHSGSSEGVYSPTPTYYLTRNRWFFLNKYSNYWPIYPLYYLKWVLWRVRKEILDGESEFIPIILGVYHAIIKKKGKGPYP
ncbi:glycosyltransferase family 2 protein [Halorubrum sp. RMP-47]|uniref:glycosyltransferase family 2 protein n=1 Tax=Halorubrum miltondacostae TaxID=3076378 RepID=UPI0035287A85